MTAPDGLPLEPPAEPDGLARLAFFAGSVAAAPAAGGGRSVAYQVPCDGGLAARVSALAARRGSEPSALAAAALLLGGSRLAALAEDPGPGESPVLVELRLAPGLDDAAIRRALTLTLALADPAGGVVPADHAGRLEARVESLEYRNKALANALERVAFLPLDGQVSAVRDAAQIFGFANEWCFDEDRVVRRFRELAPVYHPDTGVVGCRQRMAQLIEARNLLIHHVRTVYSSGAWRRR